MDTHTKIITNKDSYYEDIRDEKIVGTNDSEALKITGNRDIFVENKILIGGTEDCLDVVRTGRLVFKNSDLITTNKTRAFITDKGGGTIHLYKNINLEGNPRWWDLSFGDWTDYNSQKDWPSLKHVILDNVKRNDGKTMWILQLYCDKITKTGGTKAIIINLRWITPFWFWLKRKFSKKTNLSIPDYNYGDYN